MNVSVFGLGYVGTVLAACLSRGGHRVVGVDINPQKVDDVAAGESPIDEPGVASPIETGVEEGRLTATTDPGEAIADTSLSFVTVGTPLDETGQLSTTNLYNVMDSVARPLSNESSHSIAVRSTVPPGTTRSLRDYLRERLDGSTDVSVAVNPEFLREGSAIEDFYHPPYTVVGGFEDTRVEPLLDVYRSVDVDAPTRVVSPELAESLKMVNNAFHALKICFANEVGSVAAAIGVDGRELMALVCEDTKLNISAQYLEPGFAFGGACLPKDSRALATVAEEAQVSTPLLERILPSNDRHLERVLDAVRELDPETVGVLGLSFKAGTTDVRNSPGIRLAKRLDRETLFHAGRIDLSAVIGSNRDYLSRALPDAESRLVEDATTFVEAVDAVVVTNDGDYGDLAPALGGTPVVDPVGALAERAEELEEYHSITW